MGLKDQINEDFKAAMKARDHVQIEVLRMVKSKIQEAEVARRGTDAGDMSEDDVQQVVNQYAKQLREGAESFEKGGREDLLEQARAELAILEKYLPEQLSEAELKKIVEAAVAESGASSPKDMGNVMKLVMPQVQGKADGKVVSQLVREALK